MRTMNSPVTPTFRGLQSVGTRPREGHEGKCPSGAGRAEKETEKRG